MSLYLSEGEAWVTREFRKDVYIGEPSNLVRILNELRCDEVLISAASTPDSVLKLISDQAGMPLAIAGGIDCAFRAVELSGLGYEKISVSSAYFDNPEVMSEICNALGRASTMLTVAVSSDDSGYVLWDWRTRQKVSMSLGDFFHRAELDFVGELFVRDVARNGKLTGPDLELATLVRSKFGGNLVFEGGVRNPQDVQELWKVGINSVLASASVALYGKFRASLIDYEKPNHEDKI